MPSFSFVKLVVSDIDATVSFFQQVFGSKLVERFTMPDKVEAIVALSGEGSPDLVLECRAERQPFDLGTAYAAPGIFLESVDETVGKWAAAGGSVVKPAFTHEESGIRFAFLATPEGHQIEVLQRL